MNETAFDLLRLSDREKEFSANWFRVYTVVRSYDYNLKTYPTFPGLQFMFYTKGSDLGVYVFVKKDVKPHPDANSLWRVKSTTKDPRLLGFEVVGEFAFYTMSRKYKNVPSCLDAEPGKVRVPHASLHSSIRGRGVALFVYLTLLHHGVTLATDSHTSDAVVLWDRVSKETNTPILYLYTDVERGLDHEAVLIDRPRDDTLKLLLGKGAHINPTKVKDDRTSN